MNAFFSRTARVFLAINLFSFSFFSYAQDAEYEWVETTGVFMGSSNAEQTHDVAVDGNNNVYAIGNKGGAINNWNGNFVSSDHEGSTDIWITKFDENQNFLWNTNIGGGGIDDGFSIDVDATGNVYVTGQFQQGFSGTEFGYGSTNGTGVFTTLNPSSGNNIGFVAKINTTGTWQWVKTFEGGTCFPYSISVDPNGNVYTTGRFTGTVDFDPGAGTNNLTNSGYSNDAFISKLDNNGNHIWTSQFGAPGGSNFNDVMGRSITSDASHVYVKGYFKGTVDFKSSGDFSSKNLTGSTSYFGDYFVIKVDNGGTSTKWAHHISRSGANAYTQGRSIALGSDGVYVTGEQGSQAFVAKLSNGNFSTSQTWLKNYGSNSQGQALTVDGSNNMFITGNFGGTVDFDPNSGTQSLSAAGTKDVFISCLDLNGNYVFAKQLGGTSTNNNGMGIQLGTNGEIYSGGWFTNTTDFDPGTGTEGRSSEGSRDLYIHKMHEKSCSPVYGTDTQAACGSFLWIDGNSYTSSNNTATHTIPGGAINGCDSIVTLDLTMPGPNASGIDTRTECSPFTWIDGNTYNSDNNTATHTITGGAANGCDSIVTLNLTIDGTVDNTTDTRTECAPFTWIDGNTYNSDNNTATHTLTNQAGCDSIVTLNLTIDGTVDNTTDTRTECAPFTWIDGNTYNSDNNTATHTLTNQAGCDSIVTLDLTISGGVSVNVDNIQDVTCANGADGSAEVIASGGTPPYSYNWIPSGETTANATNLPAGTNTVEVTDAAGCATTIDVTIDSPAPIGLGTSVIHAADCGINNGSISITPGGGTPGYTFEWENGTTSSNLDSLTAGNYQVTITDAEGCTLDTSFTVNTSNYFDFYVSPTDTTILLGESIEISTNVEDGVNGTTYEWTPAEGLSCTTCTSPIATPESTTTYYVTATTPDGCSATDSVVVKVNDEDPCKDLYIPNMFSPNGDGQNDEFCVYGDCISNYQISIYDRWGELVFSSEDQTECWNGKYRGKLMNTGVFVYKLKLTTQEGEDIEASGNINLIR